MSDADAARHPDATETADRRRVRASRQVQDHFDLDGLCEVCGCAFPCDRADTRQVRW